MSEDPKSEGLNVREQNPKSDPKAGVRGLKSLLRKLSPEEQVAREKQLEQLEQSSKDSGEENKGHGSGSGMVKIALVALMILGGGVVLRKCGDDVAESLFRRGPLYGDRALRDSGTSPTVTIDDKLKRLRSPSKSQESEGSESAPVGD